MRPIDLAYVGSFKRGIYLRSENPPEEVWTWIARIGITDWLKRSAKTKGAWDDWGPYTVARVRQAVEFRTAARDVSILTRPLPLYYSLLNLLRGFIAMNEAREAKKRHGLSFVGEDELKFFDMGAEFTNGTFTDYLDVLNNSYGQKTVITLGEAFSRIVEIGDKISPSVGPNEVFQVSLEAYHSGKVRLHFKCPPGEEALFATSWQQWFPKLKDLCSLEPANTILAVDTSKVDTSTHEAITDFCYRALEVNLNSCDELSWFAIRQTTAAFDLPRPALYFIGAFILSAAVRYKPERLLDISDPDSETGWIVARFLTAAERYFPHLLLNWVFEHPLYF